MSAEEKPLHVRVAEALGWTQIHYRDDPAHAGRGCGDILLVDLARMRWKGHAPGEMVIGPQGCTIIPNFDTDWSATGPLIERFEISLRDTMRDDVLGWEAARGGWPYERPFGTTPPTAICNLILALAAAGKLPK